MKYDIKVTVFGAWRSLVAHLLWEQGVGGSNPLAPTSYFNNLAGARKGGIRRCDSFVTGIVGRLLRNGQSFQEIDRFLFVLLA
jgi:hypothetical protein